MQLINYRERDLHMEIRQIKAETITQTVKKLFMDCNYFIGKDIMTALENAYENETSPVGKSVLSQIIENDKIAAAEEVPLCQDTGMAILFVEYGDKVVIEDGSFEDAVNEGVRQAYTEGYLRKSVVSDPVFDRINTKDNTPAVIHTHIVSGNQIKITAGGKGFGSENMSAIKMLAPSYGIEGVKQFILDTVEHAGPNPCPPIVVGVGIGGTFERAAQLAKQATFRAIDTHNEDERYAALEDELLGEINKMGFGPAGLGGNTTAIGVNIETAPTHIAGMPVAVNICCHAARHASTTL
jgi:fumarate hydratase subunit alpha